jgi:hypothetical protein
MKTPHVQVELAVLWADKTWDDGHFEYIPSNMPELAIKAAAIAKLEEKLKDSALVCMISVYAVDGSGQVYDSDGERLDPKKYTVKLFAEALVRTSVEIEALSPEEARERALALCKAGNAVWEYRECLDETIETEDVTETV